MTFQLDNIIVARLEKLRDDIVARIEQNGITASGRTQRSIVVERHTDGARVVALAGNRAPVQTLEIGRPAGNVPGGFRTTKAGVRDVSNTFKAILVEWAANKGFQLSWGGATMLGRRIAAQGTIRHRQPVDVYSTLVNEAAADIREAINNVVIAQIKSNF